MTPEQARHTTQEDFIKMYTPFFKNPKNDLCENLAFIFIKDVQPLRASVKELEAAVLDLQRSLTQQAGRLEAAKEQHEDLKYMHRVALENQQTEMESNRVLREALESLIKAVESIAIQYKFPETYKTATAALSSTSQKQP